MSAASATDPLSRLLDLAHAPVGVAFLAHAPAGVARVDRAAAAGGVFYTEAADHHNCPIGAHTHGVALPSGRAAELEQVVGTMVGLQYIRMAEVPAIPRRTEPFGVAVYAPLGRMPVEPDVVLVRGNARQIMLVAEAARAAGLGGDGAALGRPACAMIPEAMQAGRGNTSLGCIGNRVYTGLGDAELYFTIPGPRLGEVVSQIETIVRANRELERYHQARLAAL